MGVEDLRAQAAMLDLLARHIDLMNQGLNLLVRVLAHVGLTESVSCSNRADLNVCEQVPSMQQTFALTYRVRIKGGSNG